MGRLYIYAVIGIVLLGATMSMLGSSNERAPIFIGQVLSKDHDHDPATGLNCNYQVDIFARNNDRPKSTWGPYTMSVDSATYNRLKVGQEVRYYHIPEDTTHIVLVP